MPINNVIVQPSNPFRNLSSKQIDLYFWLKSIKDYLAVPENSNSEKFKSSNLIDVTYHNDGSFSVSNEVLAGMMRVATRTVSVNLKSIWEAGIVDIKYTPDGGGTIRKIYWKGLPHE